MNGYDVYKKALTRLGYTAGDDRRLIEKAPELIGQIAADLRLEPPKDMSEDLKLKTDESEALCCGVAMMLSLYEGDGEKNKIFCELYNAKRAGVLRGSSVIVDSLPSVGSEGL